MTDPQRVKLMSDWWPAACAAQGWDKSDRVKRMEVLSEAVGRPLASASDLDSTRDIDRVKAHLGMLCSRVAATIETEHPEIGEDRRLRAVIRITILPCMALYEPNPYRYFVTVAEGQARWNKTDRPGREITLEDLSGAVLHRVLMTLNGRLHAKRSAAGDSVREMKIKAGIFAAKNAESAKPEMELVEGPF